MNPDPKQLLQIIHNRGEQASVPARNHDEAREAAKLLNDWITEKQKLEATSGAVVEEMVKK